jgi:hypothetical protein
MLSPRFDEHPVIQERLGRAADGEISHRDALTGIDRDVIREMAKMDHAPTSAHADQRGA